MAFREYISKFLNKNKIRNSTKQIATLSDLKAWLGIDDSLQGGVLNEVTYYVCLRTLAETMAKMPLKLYKHTKNGNFKAENDIIKLLQTRPNSIMTPSVFWSAVVLNEKHYGNAYVWIRRSIRRLKNGGAEMSIKDLWVMPSENVTVLIDDKGIFGDKGKLHYRYTDSYSGETYLFNDEEVLHFKNSFSFSGIMGKSVREILKDTIEGNSSAQRFMNKLYKNGMTARVALNYTGELNDDLTKQLLEKYKGYTNGIDNAGSVVPVPLGFKLEPLNIKLTDAQFFELKKYSALQIAAAFGIKPNQINDYEKSSYSNSEQQQMAYYIDTALFNIKNYEEEMKYKLLSDKEIEEGLYFKFNEKVLLRVDSLTQAEILSKYVNNGIYSPNEAREVLDLPQLEGGDTLIVNGNYIPITDVGKQYTKGDTANVKND